MPTIGTRDIETYYELAGSSQPLLFIHGLGSTADGWTLQVPAFADTCQVITYDVSKFVVLELAQIYGQLTSVVPPRSVPKSQHRMAPSEPGKQRPSS